MKGRVCREPNWYQLGVAVFETIVVHGVRVWELFRLLENGILAAEAARKKFFEKRHCEEWSAQRGSRAYSDQKGREDCC